MSFAEQVKYVRATLLVSQKELAKMLGVSFPTINRWETGKLEPTFLNRKKFELFCKDKNIDFKGAEI
ncbi:MAG: helix-turn-helix domain-containing protein [Clostridia bacterium]|nr:helix-turn-helix domain-containing protein [Clostridia bacterium]